LEQINITFSLDDSQLSPRKPNISIDPECDSKIVSATKTDAYLNNKRNSLVSHKKDLV
jgi:hypothetical protein